MCVSLPRDTLPALRPTQGDSGLWPSCRPVRSASNRRTVENSEATLRWPRCTVRDLCYLPLPEFCRQSVSAEPNAVWHFGSTPVKRRWTASLQAWVFSDGAPHAVRALT